MAPQTTETTPVVTEDATARQHDIPLVQVELQNVSYQPFQAGIASGKKERIEVLKDISTSIRPYQLTAWMGPSGSTY